MSGDGVTGWSVGDRVGVGYLGGHCGVCEQCRRGSGGQLEDNLRFAVQQGISAMIEEASLDDAPAAYARMMSGAARFRMVLNIA
jgi:D-arabinose 1-dehydrogenase-like Zn-dependent alcohol dehydrogenase